MSKICLYHKNCMDGFGAAYAVWKSDPNFHFFPMNYGDELPNLDDCEELVMVDFSLPLQKTEELMEKMKVIVIDHHATAAQNLESIMLNKDLLEKHESDVFFNMGMSGAIMAWQYFHATIDSTGIVYNTYDKIEPPLLLSYIQDRDLWKWNLPSSEEVSCYLFSTIDFQKTTFEEFDVLLKKFEDHSSIFFKAGSEMIKYRDKMVDFIAAKSMMGIIRTPNGEEYNIPMVNSCVFQSEVGNKLSKGVQFAAVYYFDLEKLKVVYSLRSSPDGLDVSQICKQFGGGGHKHAGGFTMDIEI